MPHVGYRYLSSFANGLGGKYFVITSNTDRLTHRAGFQPERIHACHGDIFTLQCSEPCSRRTWPYCQGDDQEISLCPECGAPARPNVYFFGDSDRSYVWEGSQKQADAFSSWLSEHGETMLMLEIGCGLGAPGLRYHSESFLQQYPATRLIRINEHEAEGETVYTPPPGHGFIINATPADSVETAEVLPNPAWRLASIKINAKQLFGHIFDIAAYQFPAP